MAAVMPLAELERTLAKLAKREPLTLDERALVQRTLDEAPAADPGEPSFCPPELAPIDDEPVTEEEEALVQEARASLARGEKGLTSEELLRSLGL